MKRMIEIKICLITTSCTTFAPMQIIYDDGYTLDAVCELNVIYNGNTYQGRAREGYWAKAYANLQNNLPQDVKIACCMTCRHGNMCPYSSCEDELFCTKDLMIRCKSDVCDLFDQTDPYRDRLVRLYCSCDHFEYQSDSYYTYNDFLYYLNLIT